MAYLVGQMIRVALFPLLLCVTSHVAVAGDAKGQTVEFVSPGGTREACVAVHPVPGGDYSANDEAEERSLCAMDFYSGDFALCPKTFSTSPGTLVYNVSSGPYAGRAENFEAEHCRKRGIVSSGVVGDPVSYKMTMNGQETSATFAPAALLYYHFSRYFGSHVDVPVSVWRSMDRKEHFERVVRTGLAVSANGGSPMNRAGWEMLAEGAKDPGSYRPTSELYTDGGTQIFGILIREEGRRYGADINGTRESGWGAGQNRDFQETAPFLALRHEGPVAEAIEQGIATAKKNPELRKAMRTDPSPVQMAFWMTELSEIVVMDFIFSQQDRVGNIDYVDYWYWVEDGNVEHARASGGEPPDSVRALDPVKIRRSVINDNDAGGRVPYANFAKSTGMVGNLRHFRAETYVRLQRLAQDFEESGPLYEWLRSSFGISERQIAQVVNNTLEASRMLRSACESGRLRFSLDPHAMLRTGASVEKDVACDGS